MPTAAPQSAQTAVIAAGVLVPGHFIFAAGQHAVTKLEFDNLWEHPDELTTILNLLSVADGLPEADAVLGVPTGGQRLAQALAVPNYLNLPLIKLERIPGGAKQDFRFVSDADKKIAERAGSLRIYEDAVTTLSSIAGVVRLLDPSRQTIHSLAIWRRGSINPKYKNGVTDHYLIEKHLPNYDPADCPYPGCSANPPMP